MSNRYVSIDDLGIFLGITGYEVMRLMNRSLERMHRFFDKQAGDNTLARVMFLSLLKKSQEAQSLAEHQAHMLIASQGGEYRPFISGEVNRAIKNLMDAHKPILDTLKALQEKSPANIFINPTDNSQTQNQVFITTTEASKMLTDSPIPTLLTDETLLLGMGESLKDLPDVNAKSQDLTSIGIKYTGPESLSQFQASEEAKKVK